MCLRAVLLSYQEMFVRLWVFLCLSHSVLLLLLADSLLFLMGCGVSHCGVCFRMSIVIGPICCCIKELKRGRTLPKPKKTFCEFRTLVRTKAPILDYTLLITRAGCKNNWRHFDPCSLNTGSALWVLLSTPTTIIYLPIKLDKYKSINKDQLTGLCWKTTTSWQHNSGTVQP